MNNEYTAVIKHEKGWWFGWIEEIPGINCQEKSKEDLLDSLRIVLTEALNFNKEEALSSAGSDYQEETIAL